MEKTHSQKLRDTLQILLATQLGEYEIDVNGSLNSSPSIRIVPPQVPDYIKMKVVETDPTLPPRGIECLVYQDPRIEPSSMQPDFEYYEVAIRQHCLDQPTTTSKKLITSLFPAVKQVRIQQAQIRGMVNLEQVNFEIPRFYNFDSDYILEKTNKLINSFS